MQTLFTDTGQTKPITDLRLDGGTQMRAGGVDQKRVAEYAELYRSGHLLPPVVVFDDGRDLWLADGFHRVEARQQAGLADVSCDIRPGTHGDAFLFALSANAHHGLRRTAKDLQHSIRQALQHDGLAERTDTALAELIVCAPATIAKVRKELVAAGTIPDHRVRKDAAGHEVAVRGEEAEKTVPGQSVLDTSPLPFAEVWQPSTTMEATNRSDNGDETIELDVGEVRWRGNTIELGIDQIMRPRKDEGAKWATELGQRLGRSLVRTLRVWAADLSDADTDDLGAWIAASQDPSTVVEIYRCKLGKKKPYESGTEFVHPSLGQQMRGLMAEVSNPPEGHHLHGNPLLSYLHQRRVNLDAQKLLGYDAPGIPKTVEFAPTTITREHEGETLKLKVSRSWGGFEVTVMGVKGFTGSYEGKVTYDEDDAGEFKTDDALIAAATDLLAKKLAVHRRREASKGSKASAKEKGPTLKERRAKLKRERECELAKRLAEVIKGWEVTPVAEDLVRLVVGFGYRCASWQWKHIGKDLDRDLDQVMDNLWKDIRNGMIKQLMHNPSNAYDTPPTPGELTTLASFFDFNVEAAWQQVQADQPEPPEWTAKVKKPAAAKKTTAKKAATKKTTAKKKGAAKKTAAAAAGAS